MYKAITLLLLPAVCLAQTSEEMAPPVATQPAEMTGPQPKLVVSTTVWDFGQKWFGEPCSTEVTLENAGDAVLKIVNIRTSCGCTVAKPKKRELAPGESDTMTLTYNTHKNKRNVSQTITIETNDPTQPRVAVQVKGEVLQVYDAQPGMRITFGRLERDSEETQTVELSNNMEEDVFLKLAPVDQSNHFDVKLEEIKPGRQYKLVATTVPPLKAGANSINIDLETGLEKFPKLSVPVSAYVAPRVAVTPARLYVSERMTKPFQRIVRVTFRPQDPIQITEIKSSHPDLITAELRDDSAQKIQSAKRFHEILVSLPAGTEFPEGGAKLEIHTDDPSPEYQTLTVDIQMRKLPTARRIPPNPNGQPAGVTTTQPSEAGSDEAQEDDDDNSGKPD